MLTAENGKSSHVKMTTLYLSCTTGKSNFTTNAKPHVKMTTLYPSCTSSASLSGVALFHHFQSDASRTNAAVLLRFTSVESYRAIQGIAEGGEVGGAAVRCKACETEVLTVRRVMCKRSCALGVH